MAKLSVKEIQNLAKSIVAENPGGIRYSLKKKISTSLSPIGSRMSWMRLPWRFR
jgi:hypothetical protein